MLFTQGNEFYEVKETRREQLFNNIKKLANQRDIKLNVGLRLREPNEAYVDGLTLEINVGEFFNDRTNLCPIIAIYHELGHWFDINKNFNGDIHDYFNGTQGTAEMEVRAWENAVVIAYKLGFEEWDVFYKYCEYCLGTYLKNSFALNMWNMRRRIKDVKEVSHEVGMQRVKQLIEVTVGEELVLC